MPVTICEKPLRIRGPGWARCTEANLRVTLSKTPAPRGGGAGVRDSAMQADQIAWTSLTSGIVARMRRSIPCFTVIDDMGQEPQAPTRRNCSTP